MSKTTTSLVRAVSASALLICTGCNLSADEVDASSAAASPATAPAAAARRPAAANFDEKRFSSVCVLRPEKLVKLKAQIGGEVRSVFVKQGEKVKAGQTLATLDIDSLKLRRERSEIELRKLVQRAELLNYQITKTEKEVEAIQGPGGVNAYFPRYGKEMAALVERRSDLQDNILNQAAARIDLRTFDDQIARAAVRAPFAGVVLTRSVEPGMIIGSVIDNASGGDVLFEVADPSKLVAQCVAKEADALLLVNGKKAELSIDGLAASRIPGRVGSVSPVIANDSGISRREFFVELGSVDVALLSGMNATVWINAQ